MYPCGRYAYGCGATGYFNSLGMPTSTTVSMVFELVGGTVAIALVKIASSSGALQLGDLLNTEKAFTVILGIFLSVAIAFSLV